MIAQKRKRVKRRIPRPDRGGSAKGGETWATDVGGPSLSTKSCKSPEKGTDAWVLRGTAESFAQNNEKGEIVQSAILLPK